MNNIVVIDSSFNRDKLLMVARLMQEEFQKGNKTVLCGTGDAMGKIVSLKRILGDVSCLDSVKVGRDILNEVNEAKDDLAPKTNTVDKSIIPFEKKGPLNAKKKKMTILFGCSQFDIFSGMPKYNLNLAKQLSEMGIRVIISSNRLGDPLQGIAEENGIECMSFADIDSIKDVKIDAMVLSEQESVLLLEKFPNTPAVFISHSKMACDKPITGYCQIRKYLAPRKQVSNYWKKVCNVDFDILPIPIDFQTFSAKRSASGTKHKILVPCTVDLLRRPMFLNLIKRAKQKNVYVEIIGEDLGALEGEKLPDRFRLLPPVKDMAGVMAQYDEVAGIYIGTVTLEAWAMGKITSVYDSKGKYRMVKPYSNFKESHDVINVAKKLVDILKEKDADIIIPHYDQAALLAQTLKSIDMKRFNVIIVRGGSYANGCNKGAKLAGTDNLIFSNDDMVLSSQALWRLCDSAKDIVGIKQKYPDGSDLCLGIFINQFGNYELSNDPEKVMYPSGAIYRVKKKVWQNLKGLNEKFINGGEDQDFFLRALEQEHTLGFVEGEVIHYCSQSTGRFDHMKQNDVVLHNLWPEDRLLKILGVKYKQESEIQFRNRFNNIDTK